MINGGSTIATVIDSGGAEDVHGSLSAATVNNGGSEVLFTGGSAVSTTVSSGGTIDVTYLSYVSGGSASVGASGLLTVSMGGHSYAQQLASADAKAKFNVAKDAASGTLLIATVVPCYAAGTFLLTDRGEVAIEHLRVGDRVRSAFGGSVPVVWIGRRYIDCRRHPRPRAVWPVRIRAGAFGNGRPGRDLRLSPDHCLYLNEVLIPIRCLIDGAAIAQQPADDITYFHLELPRHDVVYAEGLPAESYLDTGNRAAFENDGPAVQLHADFALQVWLAKACAEQITHGPKLEAARRLVRTGDRARNAQSGRQTKQARQ